MSDLEKIFEEMSDLEKIFEEFYKINKIGKIFLKYFFLLKKVKCVRLKTRLFQQNLNKYICYKLNIVLSYF